MTHALHDAMEGDHANDSRAITEHQYSEGGRGRDTDFTTWPLGCKVRQSEPTARAAYIWRADLRAGRLSSHGRLGEGLDEALARRSCSESGQMISRRR
jgi:hypothetical protein